MSGKVEGTIVLEGLVEGPMPPFPDAPAKLEGWSKTVAHGKLRMNVQIDGGHFSALPANAPLEAKSLGEDPSATIADALADLLRYFPPLEKSQIFSTLRSIEWQPKQEIRTLYAVAPDGKVVTRQERVACETYAPQAPLNPKELAIRAGMGLVIAAAILGISSFFVDYPKLWRRLTAAVEPAHAVVNTGSLAPYFTLEVKAFDRQTGALQIRLTRTKAYPLTEAALDALYEHPAGIAPGTMPASAPATAPASAPATAVETAPASAPATAASAPPTVAASGPATTTAAVSTAPAVVYGTVRQRLAIDALGRGLVRLDYRDDKGRVIGQALLRIADLQNYESVETAVPAPIVDERPAVPATIDVLP